jgi:hypothetical protein
MECDFLSTILDARDLIRQKRFSECEAVLATAMFSHPHDAVPHNLMGLLLEGKGCHVEAMRHFRAAYALDPTYRPAAWNLDCFGSFYRVTEPAYQASDCEDATGDRKGDN